MENEWQREWQKEIKERHYLSFQPKVKRISYYQGNRKDSVKICRLRLGHCGLNSYLHIIGKHSSGLCECGSPETVKHILLECSKYSVERRELFKTASDLGLNSFSVKSLFSLHDNHQQIMAAILQFLRNTGLYVRI